MLENILAKSGENGGTSLVSHSIGVLNFGMYVYNRIVGGCVDTSMCDEMCCTLALHDIGKCNRYFQKDLVGNVRTKYTEHNVLGWCYLFKYTDVSDSVLSGVLHHHIIFSDTFGKTANGVIGEVDADIEGYNCFFDIISAYLKNNYHVDIHRRDKKRMDSPDISSVGVFYDINISNNCSPIESFIENGRYLLQRSILLYADRVVSSLSGDIDMFVNNNEPFMRQIYNNTINMRNGFLISDIDCKRVYGDTDITRDQNNVLSIIRGINHCILDRSAGSGKTLIGLRWLLEGGKKGLWVTPQNMIARGTYESLKNEIKAFGLDDKVSIGLLLTGRYEHGNEDCDIIVTNIDNFLGPIFRNCDSRSMLKLFGSNVVFDEFHNFLCDEPLFAGFITTMFTRSWQTNSKSLMLSATALGFERVFWGDRVVRYSGSNIHNGEMKIHIGEMCSDDVEHFKFNSTDSLIIAPTVNKSQRIFKSFVHNNNDLLLHSLFSDEDRVDIEEKVYKYHDKHSIVSDRNVVVGTCMIGTGHDISARYVYDFMQSPEDTIQRGCGRCGRFNEKEYQNGECYYYMCDDGKAGRVMKHQYDDSVLKDVLLLRDKWRGKLKPYFGTVQEKNLLYKLYFEYYAENRVLVSKVWKSMFDISMSKLRRLRPYPIRMKKYDDSVIILSSRSGLRGDNDTIFVKALISGTNGLSGNIAISKDFIDMSTMPEEFENKYIIKRMDLIKSVNENAKYDKSLCNKIFDYAKRSDTPFVLYEHVYDKRFGLILKDI